MNRRRYLQIISASGTLSLSGCSSDVSTADDVTMADKTLTLTTSTTTHDSGLLKELIPGFEELFGSRVETIVRGTGGALRTARDGDCDAVFVHARPLEDHFLRGGYGINRRAVMVNDFLIVGPPDDPAGIARKRPISAFEAISNAEVSFVSRGDRSGTHLRERQLWTEAGIEPHGSWYIETGQGMGNTLLMAAQTDAYTLTDRGTFLNIADNSLVAHVDHGIVDPPPLLRNEYAVIPVNPARHDVAYPQAMAFTGYLTGLGQRHIDEFRVADEQSFRPVALEDEPAFGQYVPRDWEG